MQEFLAAERLRETRRRKQLGLPQRVPNKIPSVKKKKRGKSLPQVHVEAVHLQPPNTHLEGSDTFALTATGAEEWAYDDILEAQNTGGGTRSQSSAGAYASQRLGSSASSTPIYSNLQSRASTALGLHGTDCGRVQSPESSTTGRKVDLLLAVDVCDAGTQVRPIELEEKPVDRVLRRYAFSLEWDHGTLGPGLLNSTTDAAPKPVGQQGELGNSDDSTLPETDLAAIGTDPDRANLNVPCCSTQDSASAVLAQTQIASMLAKALAETHKDEESSTDESGQGNVSQQLKSQSAAPDPGGQRNTEAPSLKAVPENATSGAASQKKLANTRRASQSTIPSRVPKTKSDASSLGIPVTIANEAENSHQSIAIPCTNSSLTNAESEFDSELSMSSLCSSGVKRSKNPSARARNTPTPAVGMRFYEVKLTERETDPPIDYSVDFRRYSYTDFKIPERGEGSSTVDPELVADWLDRAVPRNQDDAHPLFVLCKDLLRKFHLKEIRYAVRKEQDMLTEIHQLHEELVSDKRRTDALQLQQNQAEARAAQEAQLVQQQMENMRNEMNALGAELESYKELEVEIDHMRQQMPPELMEMQASTKQEADDLRSKLHKHHLLAKLRQLIGAKDLEREKEASAIRNELAMQVSTLGAIRGQLEDERRRANEAEEALTRLR